MALVQRGPADGRVSSPESTRQILPSEPERARQRGSSQGATVGEHPEVRPERLLNGISLSFFSLAAG